jgi:hypothetical protein
MGLKDTARYEVEGYCRMASKSLFLGHLFPGRVSSFASLTAGTLPAKTWVKKADGSAFSLAVGETPRFARRILAPENHSVYTVTEQLVHRNTESIYRFIINGGAARDPL